MKGICEVQFTEPEVNGGPMYCWLTLPNTFPEPSSIRTLTKPITGASPGPWVSCPAIATDEPLTMHDDTDPDPRSVGTSEAFTESPDAWPTLLNTTAATTNAMTMKTSVLG